MKKTSFNHWVFVLIFGGLLMTFVQCDKEFVTADMTSTAMEIRGNGVNTQGDADNPGNQANQDLCNCLTENFELEALTNEEISALVFMVEEEKLARDVYDFLYEKWEHRVFDRISNSEQQHMDALDCLIGKYDLVNPVTNDLMGEFTDQLFATLYGKLTAEGSVSLEAAFRTGAAIEDLDIFDLMNAMEMDKIDNADILAVFGELTKGSRNHLRAFVKNLANVGADYTPLKITVDLFEEIIGSERELGGGICAGLDACVSNNNRLGRGNGPGTGDGSCDGTGQNGNSGNGPSNGPNNSGTPSGTCDGSGPNGNGKH